MDRRTFLKQSSTLGSSFLVGTTLTNLFQISCARTDSKAKPLQHVNYKIPPGFNRKTFSFKDTPMFDGKPLPGKHDGMGCFASPYSDGYILLRNHELSPEVNMGSAFPEYSWDPSAPGGVTAVHLDKDLNVTKEFYSLVGTVRNCSGGKTPWNTWISCEEHVEKHHEKHGYAFEVNPISTQLTKVMPLKTMGRFQREGVAFDDRNHIVYQTEDQDDGCFYRFIPNVWGDLTAGGKLQALKVLLKEKYHTTNDRPLRGQSLPVEWVDIEEVDPDEDTIRLEAQSKSASIFVNGEGILAIGQDIFFSASHGGDKAFGQIFKYIPKDQNHGKLELVFEGHDKNILYCPDQMTYNQWGDLIVCEDSKNLSRLIGIRPDGGLYLIATHEGSEWTGVCFSPDYKVLFANIQNPGFTVALEGNWQELRQSATSK